MGVDNQVELEPLGDNIIRTHDWEVKFNPNGLGDEYYKQMMKNGHKIAQIDGITGRTQTYGELLARCVQTAEAMRRYGIKPGDLVCQCSGLHLNSCVPIIACFFIGARYVAIDIDLPEDDMETLLPILNPKVIFSSQDAVAVLEKNLGVQGEKSRIIVFEDAEGDRSFEGFLKSAPEIHPSAFQPYKAKSLFDTVMLALTGGSTGHHKVACLHHWSLARFVSLYPNISRNTVMMGYSPMMWISGPFNVCTSVAYGYSRVILPTFEADKMFHIVDKFKVNSIWLTSIAIQDILRQDISKDVDLTSLKHIMFGGSAIAESSMVAIRKRLPHVAIMSGYGQTEVGGFITDCEYKKYRECYVQRPRTIGRPIKGFWYKIVDINTGETVGPNQRGELRVKTKFQMNGYFKMDSSYVWDSDGWLKTGDIVYYDEDHFFFYVDRIKEMMRYRDWPIAPVYLESILLQHPAVHIAFVTGVPHELDGDHPTAVVVLKYKSSRTTPEELELFVNERVEERKKLRAGVTIVDISFVPFSVSGKLKRYRLREKILSLIKQRN